MLRSSPVGSLPKSPRGYTGPAESTGGVQSRRSDTEPHLTSPRPALTSKRHPLGDVRDEHEESMCLGGLIPFEILSEAGGPG